MHGSKSDAVNSLLLLLPLSLNFQVGFWVKRFVCRCLLVPKDVADPLLYFLLLAFLLHDLDALIQFDRTSTFTYVKCRLSKELLTWLSRKACKFTHQTWIHHNCVVVSPHVKLLCAFSISVVNHLLHEVWLLCRENVVRKLPGNGLLRVELRQVLKHLCVLTDVYQELLGAEFSKFRNECDFNVGDQENFLLLDEDLLEEA